VTVELIGGRGPGSGRRVVLVCASTIAPEPIRWLWRDRLPLLGLSLLGGEAGLGKSTLTVELAARVSRGELEGDLAGQPKDVLIASAEDHFASVVLGRLKAAGARLDRIHHVTVSDAAEGGVLTLPDDVTAIESACEKLAAAGKPPALLIIDPVGAYIATGTDTHRDAAVRRVLAPLAALSERQGLVVLGVVHLNKDRAARLLDRIGGSVAFGAAPRSVVAFARDPDDPDGERGYRRVIVHVKTNWGAFAPTLAAHLDVVEVPVVGRVSHLAIDGECDIGPDDLRAGREEERTETDLAAEWLEAELAGGQWHPSAPIKTRATAEGITPKALRGARERLHVENRRSGYPAVSEWRLPVVPAPPIRQGHDWTGHDRQSPAPKGDSTSLAAWSCPHSQAGHDWGAGTTAATNGDLSDSEHERPLIAYIKDTLDAIELSDDEAEPEP
jgi:hypothetical protein